MFLNIAYFLLEVIINMYLAVMNTVGLIIPSWFGQGISGLFTQGAGMMNNWLPVYPHPEMTGIVQTVGISTVVAWVAGLIEIGIILGIVFGVVYLFIRIIPWNTQK